MNLDIYNLTLYFYEGKDLSNYVFENYNWYDLWNAVENGATPPNRNQCNTFINVNIRSITNAVLGTFTTPEQFLYLDFCNRDLYYIYLKAIGQEPVSPVFFNQELKRLYSVFTVGSGFDADYQAVLDYATLQGYTLPSSDQQVLQNQWVLDLKTSGIWSKLDLLALFATDGDSDFALINWKALNTMAAVNSPTFDTNQGFTGDGATAYIDTLIAPLTSVQYSLNSASFGYYTQNTISASQTRLGTRIGFNNAMSYDFSGSNMRINTGTTANITSDINAGLHMYSRINSTTVRKDYNGINQGTALDNSTNLSSFNFYALALNNSGTAIINSNNQLALVFSGSDLTNESLQLYNAFNNYFNAI